MAALETTVAVPLAGGPRRGCAVFDNFNGGEWIAIHCGGDSLHGFVRRPDASHRGMRRSGYVTRSGLSRMHSNSWVARYCEPDNTV